jgi:hypothetical protein
VLITEILPDPSPSYGLPEAEFVEITNAGNISVILGRWKITDGQSAALIPEGTVLEPDSSLILCSRNNQSLFIRFGRCLGLSGFPSLDNAGDQIQLLTAAGSLMHAVSYTPDSYQNTLKAAGGWSLEMADTRWPCAQKQNWKASLDPAGGTPGRRNSLPPIPPDTIAPFPERTYSPDSLTIVVLLNETLDSAMASMPGRYTVDQGIGSPVRASPQPPFFREVRLTLANALQAGKIYALEVSGLADCAGNAQQFPLESRAAVAAHPEPASALINEILFDPPPGGSDYLELYNHSGVTIDLAGIYVGNRNSSGQPSSLVRCSETPRNLYPGEYAVLTGDTAWVRQRYAGTKASELLESNSMPSWPDDEGVVIVANQQGTILDELTYADDDHFPLLSNREGVSLERLNPFLPTTDPSNWHSASTASGYGTPTLRNAQAQSQGSQISGIHIEPKLFSPNLDGFQDFVQVNYEFDQPGTVCNITVFNAAGQAVRELARNHLCGTSGTFKWDGLDHRGLVQMPGVYHIMVEVFNTSGHRKKLRHSIALVHR